MSGTVTTSQGKSTKIEFGYQITWSEDDMATMYDVPLYSIDDTYEIVDDEDDEDDDYPFLGEKHEHIADNWLVVDSEDYIIDIGPIRRPPTDLAPTIAGFVGMVVGEPLGLIIG